MEFHTYFREVTLLNHLP